MAAKDKARGAELELHVGRKFGGRRRRNGEGLGFDDCIMPDGSPLPISFECKAYAVLQLKTSWIEQAIRNCTGRPWAVVQRPKGSRRIYATVDLDFLYELAVKAGVIEEGAEDAHRQQGSDPVSLAASPETEGRDNGTSARVRPAAPLPTTNQTEENRDDTEVCITS